MHTGVHGFIHHRDGLTYLIMGSGSRIDLRVVLGEQELQDKLSKLVLKFLKCALCSDEILIFSKFYVH